MISYRRADKLFPVSLKTKFINRDPHYYTRRIKEAIHIRLHPNNSNRDSGVEIPEAWMLTIKKHNNRWAMRQRTTEDRNVSINKKRKTVLFVRSSPEQPNSAADKQIHVFGAKKVRKAILGHKSHWKVVLSEIQLKSAWLAAVKKNSFDVTQLG